MLKTTNLIAAFLLLIFANMRCSKDNNNSNNNQNGTANCENVIVNWGSTQIKMCTDKVTKSSNTSGNYWLLFAYNSTGTPVHGITIGFYTDALSIGTNYIPSHPVTSVRSYSTLFFMYQNDIQASAQQGSDSWVKINSINNGKFSGLFKITAIGHFASVPFKDTAVNLTGTFTDVPLTQ